MAGEIIKTAAICLGIRPWSRTSHVTSWLTGSGRVLTVVKGAVRPKSAFLGQYDLNYTCEILYYARGKNDLHALRECAPLETRDYLRTDHRKLVLAEYFRHISSELSPNGPDAADWYALLSDFLDHLRERPQSAFLKTMLAFDTRALQLSGVWPELPAGGGEIELSSSRRIPVSATTAAALSDPDGVDNPKILLDAARVISVLYALNLELTADSRRSVLQLICKPEQGQDK